jgi:hypothetical protein
VHIMLLFGLVVLSVISSNSLLRVLSLGGPTRGGVDLGIAQYGNRLAAGNWLHLKPGPQLHYLALALISSM